MTTTTNRQHMSHYDWLKENFTIFLNNINIENPDFYLGLISAHGDKCYGYKHEWDDAGIPFDHGVAIFLLLYIKPWNLNKNINNTSWKDYKFFDASIWVKDNYKKFKNFLPEPRK